MAMCFPASSHPFFSHLFFIFFFSKLKNIKKLNRRKNITEYFPVADDVPRKSIPLGMLGQIIHLLIPFSPLLSSQWTQPFVAKIDFLTPAYEWYLVAWKKSVLFNTVKEFISSKMVPEQLLAKVVLPSALSVEGGQEPSLEPLSLLQVKVRSLASNCQNPSMPVSAITSLSKD